MPYFPDRHRHRHVGLLERAAAGAIGTAMTLGLLVPAIAHAGSSLPPGPRGCVPAVGTNQIILPLPGIFLPLPSIEGLPEFERLPAAPAGVNLPDRVDFRDGRHGFNGYVEVVLREGSLYTRPQDSHDPWRAVPTPGCLDGHIVAMSLDSNMLVALDSDGWIYSLDNLLSGPMLWNWTRSFGGPIWLWPGMPVMGSPEAEGTWVLSHRMSESFVDARGYTHPTTAGLVQVLNLSEDGSRIVYQDPWLPPDYSYEIGGPLGGRFLSEAVSSSESVNFVINRFGDMYTRKYDLDLAGANHIPGRYSWQEQGDLPTAPTQLHERFDPQFAAISLPAEEWHHQPKIPGEVTARISVIDTGTRMEDKELRVEGRRGEHTGFWHKHLEADSWDFTPTGLPLERPVLHEADPSVDQSAVELAAPSGLDFEGGLPDGWTARTEDFDWAQTTHAVTLTSPTGRDFEVKMYTTDGLRLVPRAPGLDESPRPLEGAFDLRPAEPWAPENEELGQFARAHFRGNDVFEIGLLATTESLVIGHAGVYLPHLGTWQRVH